MALWAGNRPLISFGGGGGWIQGPQNVCVPKISLTFPAPLINLAFAPRKTFLMWVGG